MGVTESGDVAVRHNDKIHRFMMRGDGRLSFGDEAVPRCVNVTHSSVATLGVDAIHVLQRRATVAM